MLKSWEIVVTRRVQNRFVIEARTQNEASMKLGVQMIGEDPFAGSDEIEVSRTTKAPRLIPTESTATDAPAADPTLGLDAD
jgi:hypothetical protein